MIEHTVTLHDDEFKLFQRIRQYKNKNDAGKQQFIDELVRQIETFLVSHSSKKPITWLQVGDKTLFQQIEPVKPEQGAPFASDVIISQRSRLTEDRP